MREKSDLYIVEIVAIVAIVFMVILTSNTSHSRLNDSNFQSSSDKIMVSSQHAVVDGYGMVIGVILATCSDSDDLDYRVKGNVTYTYGYRSKIPHDSAFVEDYCYNNTELQEPFCLFDDYGVINYGWTNVNCPNRCVDGVCV